MTESSPQIRPDLSLPGVNAASIGISGDPTHPEISFAPSPKGGPEALWFYLPLQILNSDKLKGLRFRLKHLRNLLGGNVKRLYPAYRIDNGEWQRLETDSLIITEDGRREISWEMPAWGERVEVATLPYYGFKELDQLIRDQADHYKTCEIGVSEQELPIFRLSNDPGKTDSQRPGIYLTSRQHSGENTGSWVLEGILEAMGGQPNAPLIWSVPFVDVDGVCHGLYGKDRFPWDFNRAWGSKLFGDNMNVLGSHPMRHEVLVLQRDMQEWTTRCKPTLILDLHAPGLSDETGFFIYHGGLNEAKQPPPEDAPWIEALEKHLGPEFAASTFLRDGRYPSRYPHARISSFGRLGLGVRMLTFEIPYGRTQNTVLGVAEYREAGRRIGKALLQMTQNS